MDIQRLSQISSKDIERLERYKKEYVILTKSSQEILGANL